MSYSSRSLHAHGPRQLSLVLGLIALIVIGALAVGCGGTPGSENKQAEDTSVAKKPNIADAGPVTLKVWRYAPGFEAMDKAFEKKYPNVKIEADLTDYNSFVKQAKLRLSADDAPDIVEGGQGYSIDGPVIAAGLVLPLDKYAKLYGWDKAYGSNTLKQFRFSDDGKRFGEGKLWGISPAGEAIGFFYNKQKLRQLDLGVPKTYDEFEVMLQSIQDAGETPILLGNLVQFTGSWLLMAIANQTVPAQDVAGLVYGDPSAKWTSPEWEQSASELQSWVDNGYINRGFNGLDPDTAIQKFAAGDGVLMQGGPFMTAPLTKTMKDDVGFFLLPPRSGDKYVATGSLSGSYHVTTNSKHPDVAAAYIDFMMGPEGQQIIAQMGRLPANDPTLTFKEGSLEEEVRQAFVRALEDDGLVPYLDWSTVTAGDALFGGTQEVMAGKKTPTEFLEEMQTDRDEALAER